MRLASKTSFSAHVLEISTDSSRFQWDFGKISVGFQWDFGKISGFQWDSRFQWDFGDFTEISEGSVRDFA